VTLRASSRSTYSIGSKKLLLLEKTLRVETPLGLPLGRGRLDTSTVTFFSHYILEAKRHYAQRHSYFTRAMALKVRPAFAANVAVLPLARDKSHSGRARFE
jgi:hypothetical protein